LIYEHLSKEANMRGGKRIGAGRKTGSNAYLEPTKPIRVPLSIVEPLSNFLEMLSVIRGQNMSLATLCANPKVIPLPLFESKVSAGFPSPASDTVDQTLDLNQHLINHPNTTFFLKVVGDSMIDACIQEDDLLVVDRSIDAKHNDIVIAVLNGEVTVKRLIITKSEIFLKPENTNYPLIPVPSPSELIIWGVVTSVVHKFK
jgi:DNA polymerase V